MSLLSLFDTSTSLRTLYLGKEFWHSDNFLTKAQKIHQENPDVQIVHQPTRIRKNPVPVQMRQIVVDRIHFLSSKAVNNKKKKKRWDFAELMHDYKDLIFKGDDPVIEKTGFLKTIVQKRYKIPKETIEHLMDEFPRVIPSTKPKQKPKTKVDLNKMSEYYLNRFNIPPRVLGITEGQDKKQKRRKKPN